MRFIWTLVTLAVLSACTRKQASVSIDDWWSVDYAKNNCEMMAQGGHQCANDPKEEVRDFEMAITGAFATDPACNGVSLTSFGTNHVAGAPNSKLSPDWQLMLDFDDGSQPQAWTLVHHPDLRTIKGKGTAKEIAHSICMVAAGRGGLVAR
jgi:hypothetical protein